MISPRSISPFLPAGRLISALLFLAVLGGCLPKGHGLSRAFTEKARNPLYTARLNCFLNLKDDKGPAMRLEIESIDVISDGLQLPLHVEPLKIDSAALGTKQLYLGGVAVPPGRYQRLRMTLTKAEYQAPNGKYVTIVKESRQIEFNLPSDLDLEADDSQSLLVTWDVHNSLSADNSLALAMTVNTPVRQLPVDLVFVSCPDIDTIFVIRADKNWVVDSFGLKGHPTYLAIDPDPSQKRLYVLTTRDKTVKAVDLSTYGVVDYFQAPLNDDPNFMVITPDGQGVFLIDERDGYASRVNLTDGRTEARVYLGYRPDYATYLVQQNMLAVSLSLSQKVLLLDPLGLSILGTIPTAGMPEGMLVTDNQLYVAEHDSNTVSVTDLSNMATQSRFTVGLGPTRLLATTDQIFVSNYEDGSLSILLPGQNGVFRNIYGLGHPQEMAIDNFFNRLYVSDEDAEGLAVIDSTTNDLVGNISLGARPLGLGIIQ